MQLLKKFDMLMPKIFSDVITEDLNNKDKEVKHLAVGKFAVFWKITAKDYNEYKPFQPEHERKKERLLMGQHQELFSSLTNTHKHVEVDYENSSGSDGEDDDYHEKERSYVALHNMLLVLEDDDPTLRLACRSWLQESKADYLRIVDPLFKEFMDNNKMYKSFSGQLFFVNNYDSSIVIENFTKLRNIILTTQEEFVQYCVTTRCSNYITGQFKKRYQLMHSERDKITPNLCANKYIQVIVYTTLQFIMGQAVESMMDKELYQETRTVNASACEFMELILRSVN